MGGKNASGNSHLPADRSGLEMLINVTQSWFESGSTP
tara:strand:- start:122 stop:232 length:111 start_codon:yes stop_codon:yes gene_type:complete